MSYGALTYLRRQYLCVLRRCSALNASAAWAALAAAGVVASPAVLAAPDIVPDGRTQTRINTQGAVSDITTATVRGNNAFNSFSRFNIAAGETVNLQLPASTTNLLNLVRDQRSVFDGVLNAFKDGRIGGNVFFFNPHGLVVGAQGQLNVGSLTLVAPTPGTLDRLVSAAGVVDDAAVAQALAGRYSLGDSGLIRVKGTINAARAVQLAAHQVEVDAGARVQAGAAARVGFGALVNLDGLNEAALMQQDGDTIRIVAAQDVRVAGAVAADGAAGQAAGRVTIHAGGNVNVTPGARVSADGQGAQSDGGTVYVMAQDTATLAAGSELSARGGQASGDGGHIEFSAQKTVRLEGGALKAGATGGRAGSVLIDPNDIEVVAANQYTDGADFTLIANNSITVGDNVTISTRNLANVATDNHLTAPSQGDSGSLTLRASAITLNKGSRLLAHANNGRTGGDVSVEASTLDAVGATRNATATLTATEALVMGRDVVLRSSAETSAVMELLVNSPNPPNVSLADAQRQLNLELQDPVNAAGGAFLTATTQATATTTLAGTVVQGSGKVQVGSRAGARAGFEKTATASTTVGNSGGVASQISGNTVDISATASTSLVYNVLGTAAEMDDPSWTPDPAGSLVKQLNDSLFDFNSIPLVSLSKAKATTTISGATQLTAADTLTVRSEAESAAKPTFAGLFVFSAAWGESTAEADTQVGGSSQLSAANALKVRSRTSTDIDVTATINTVNKPIDATFVRANTDIITKAEVGAGANLSGGSVLVDAQTKALINAEAIAANTGGSGVGLALALSHTTSATTATLGGTARANSGNATVTAEADIKEATNADASTLGDPNTISAKITNLQAGMQRNVVGGVLGATGQLSSSQSDSITKFMFPGIKEGKFNASGAVSFTESVNDATASVASGADVRAQGDVSVRAKITDAPNSSAGAKSTSTGTAVGGAVAWGDFNNNATAFIGQNAKVDAMRLVQVDAQTLVPYPWQINWQNPQEILAFLQGGVLDMFLTTHSINSAKGKSGVGLAVGVNLFNLDNSAVAYVDRGALVNSVYTGIPGLAQQSVSVTAGNDISLTGASGILSKKFLGTSGGKAAIGGSASFVGIDTTASATLRGSAQVNSATTVDVAANNQQRVVTVTEAGGSSDSVGVEGTVTINTLGNSSLAAVDDDATVRSTGDLRVKAAADLQNIAVAGGVVATKGPVGIGFSVSLNTVKSTVSALVGNIDLPSDDVAGANGLLQSGGRVVVDAQSTLSQGAYSVVGAIATSSKAQTDAPEAGSSQETQDGAGSAAGSSQSGKGKFGIAVSGDVSINSIEADTLATVTDGARITQATALDMDATQKLALASLAGAVTISTSEDGNSLAGSYAQNTLSGTTASRVNNASVNLSGGLTADAQVTGSIDTLSASIAGAKGKVGVAGSVSINSISNQTQTAIHNTLLTGVSNVDLNASDDSAIRAIAGAIAFGGKAGVGLSFGWNQLSNSTESGVSDSDIDASGLVTIQARTNNSIDTISAAIGASKGAMAASGAVTVNTIRNATRTFVSGQKGGDGVDGAAGVVLAASDSSRIFGLAGALGASSDKAGVGVSFAWNEVDNVVDARLKGNTSVESSAGSVAVGAVSTTHVEAVSAAGGVANKVGLAGAGTVVQATNAVGAAIEAGSTAVADGNVQVAAADDVDVFSLAGNVAVGGKVGIGASASLLITDNTVSARVDGSATGLGNRGAMNVATGRKDSNGVLQTESSRGVAVTATSFEDIQSIAAGGAGGGNVGVAGSATVTLLDETTEAVVGSTGRINPANNGAAPQDVTLRASDSTQLLGVAGAVAFGGKAGVGAGADVAVVDKQTQAVVAAGALVNAKDTVTVDARSSEDLRSVAASLAAGGSAGIAGSASVYTLNVDTVAEVGNGATVRSDGNVVVSADAVTELDQIAGNGAFGGTAGVGASVAVSIIDKSTLARVGQGATVTALGKAAGVAVADGSYTARYDANSTEEGEINAPALNNSNGSNSGALSGQRVGSRNTTAGFTGLAVTATNQLDVESVSATGAAAGSAAVTLAGGVNVVTTNTTAELANGAQINQANSGAAAGQSVRVAAGNDHYQMGVAGAASGAGGVGIGVGADVLVAQHHTSARVGDNAQVRAVKDVSVLANSQQEILSIAAGLGVAGSVAVAGSTTVLSLSGSTQATTGTGSVVDADGNVRIRAVDDTQTDVIDGALSAGFGVAGVGGAVGVVRVHKDTTAGVGANATVNARGNGSTAMQALSGDDLSGRVGITGLSVEARSSEDLFAVAASGAGGFYAGVSGAVHVASLDSDTTAALGDGARINQGVVGASGTQDVNVSASNSAKLSAGVGSLGLGAVGASGAVDVTMVRNDTTADIGNGALVTARRDVDVNALSSTDVGSVVVSAAGGIGAVAGAVSVVSVGSGLDSESRDRLKSPGGDQADVNSYADSQAGNGSINGLLSQSSDARIRSAGARSQAARGSVAVSSDLGGANTSGTSARVGRATVTAGGAVDIDARQDTDVRVDAGAAAGGGLGLGAGVGVLTLNQGTQAQVAAQASLSSGGLTSLTARTDNDSLVNAYAGVLAGVVAVDAAAAIVNDKSSTWASLGDDVTLISTSGSNAGAVDIAASDSRKAQAVARGVSVSGSVAAGASVAVAEVDGSTVAEVGDGLTAGPALNAASPLNSLRVQANSVAEAQAESLAGKAGLGLAASGSVATAQVEPVVRASVGDGSRINASGLVQIDATARAAGQAEATGVNVAGGVGIGASVATVHSAPQVDARLGGNTNLRAGDVRIEALAALPSFASLAQGTGASGGLLAGVNATAAEATYAGQTAATLGNNSTLTVTGGLTVKSQNDSAQTADVTGLSLGFLAAGATVANSESDSSSLARLGDGVQVAAPSGYSGSISVLATGQDVNHAKAVSGSGGYLSGSAASASTSGTSDTRAHVGRGDAAHSLNATTFTLLADHSTRFNAEVDSISAAVYGASGAASIHAANGTVQATIADNARINAQHVDVDANNRVLKLWLGSNTVAQDAAANADTARWNIQSGSGGALNGAAGSARSAVTQNTLARVGAGAQVHVTMPATGEGTFTLDALNQVVGHDKAKLDSGGLVAVALTETRFIATGNATAEVGAGASVISDLGDIRMGSSAQVDLDTRASADTYGLAGAPRGQAISSWTGNNRTVVNTGALLLADQGGVQLGAGQSSGGTRASVQADSDVRLWNKTVIPINGTPDAQTRVTSNSSLELLGTSRVETAGDITLTADQGRIDARHVGIGKDIYRETGSAIVSEISTALGGDKVSFDITGGETVVQGAGVARVDGSALAGIHRFESLTLDYQLVDANNNPVTTPVIDPVTKTVRWRLRTTATDGVNFTVDPGVGLANAINARITKLRSLMNQYAADAVAVAAYESEIKFLQFKLVELGLAKGDPNGSNFVVGTGSGPSPRARQLTRINQTTGEIDTLADAIVNTSSAAQTNAVGSDTPQTTVVTSAGTVVTRAVTVADNNSIIDTTLRAMGNFSASDGDYVTLNNLRTGVQTLRSDISSLSALQTPDQLALGTRSGELRTLLNGIAALETQKDNLLGSGGTAAQISAVQAQIDTGRVNAQNKLVEVSGLLDTVAARAALIDSKAATLLGNVQQINSLQTTLTSRFAVVADAARVVSVQTTQGNNTTPINDIRSQALAIDGAETLVAQARTAVASANSTVQTKATELSNAQTLLTQLEQALPGLSTTPTNGPTADFVRVGDISVRLGNVSVKADTLGGTGSLRAPGDAKISIVNNTPNFLVLGKLTVASDSGGEVRLNGFLVNNNAEIGRINASGVAPSLTLQTRYNGAAGLPEIEVISNFDPNSAKNANLPAPSPDIQLNGDISNPLGKVRVYSQAGSIYADKDVRAAQVDIKADNGDFVQSFVNGFYHSSGDPAANAQGGIRSSSPGTAAGPGIVANGSVVIGARYLNVNGLIQSGVESWQLDLPANPVLTGPASLFGLLQSTLDAKVVAWKNNNTLRFSTLATPSGGTVTFDAQLNRLEASTSFADADRLSSGWAQRTASFNGLYPLISSYGNIGANYDPSVAGGRFVLDGEQVKGGFIQLTGQLMNTADAGAARLKVIDGFGQIRVNNPTDRAVVVGNLSTGTDASGTGRGIRGVIDITDVQRVNTSTGAADVIRTVYTRENNQVQVDRTGRWEGATFNPNYRYTGVDNSASGARNSAYSPQTGLRYVWTTATDKSTKTDWEFSGSQFLGISTLRTQPTGTVVSKQGPFTLATRRLDDGTYLLRNQGNTGTRLTSSSNTRTVSDVWTKTDDWSECNWWTVCIAQDYHTTWTQKTSTSTITTNSLKADYAIGIEFSGANTGLVSINSKSNVLLGGLINNRYGSTTVTAGTETGFARAGQSVLQAQDAALLSTQQLTLRASGNLGAIGSAAQPILVDLNGGALSATVSSGNVAIRQTHGDLSVGTVSASGSASAGLGQVLLQAEGSLALANASASITANQAQLISDNGSLGSAAAPLRLNLGTSSNLAQRGDYGLKAAARLGIYLDALSWAGNTNADLLVGSVVSATGDVQLRTPGRIIDNSPFERVDTRTFDQLLTLWDDLSLLRGSGNNQAKQQAGLSSFEASASQEYRQYWQLRNQQADPSVFSASHQVSLSATQVSALRADLLRQGKTVTEADAVINSYAATKTAEYRALHDKLYVTPAYQGVVPQTFVDGFAYSASSAERSARLDGASWTERELGIALSPGLLKEISDTNPVLKDPNVSGVNVSLLAGQGIGETASVRQVDLTQAPRNLSDADKVAIAAAERSDLSISSSGIASVTQRKPLVVDATGLLSVTGQSGASVAGDVFLASEGSIAMQQLRATGQARLKVAGDITHGAAAGVASFSAGNLVLESSVGAIGTAVQPVVISLLPGATLTARADGDVHIAQLAGDLMLDTVYSRHGVWLTAPGAIVDAFNSDDINIRARYLTLNAGTAIGALGNALDIGLGPRLISDTDDTGRLWATAGGAIDLRSPLLDLVLSQVQAGTNLRLVAGGSVTVDGPVTAPLGVDLAVSQALRFNGGRISSDRVSLTANQVAGTALQGTDVAAGSSLSITASQDIGLDAPLEVTTPALRLRGDRVDVQAASLLPTETLTVDVSGIGGAAASDLKLDLRSNTAVELARVAGQTVTIQAQTPRLEVKELQAGVSALVNTTGQVVHTAAAGVASFRGGTLELHTTGGDIGSASQALQVDQTGLATLDASASGDVHIRQLGGDLLIKRVVSGGLVSLQASGKLADALNNGAANVRAKQAQLVAQGSIGDLNQALVVELGPRLPGATDETGWLHASAGTFVNLASPAAPLVLRQVTAGSTVNLTGGGQVWVDGRVQAGPQADISAGGDLSFTSRGVVEGDTVVLSAGTSGQGSLVGVNDSQARVMATNTAHLSAADDLGATAPLRVQTQLADLRAQRMWVNASTSVPNRALSVNATGVGGAAASDIQLDLSSSLAVHLAQVVGQNVTVQAQTPQLEVRDVRASTQAQISTDGNVVNAAAPGVAAYRGGNLDVKTTAGSIGSSGQALVVDMAAGATVDAGATADIYIQQLGGDLLLKRVSTGGAVGLQASGSILDALGTGAANIRAQQVNLQAQGSIGTASQALTLELGPRLATDTDQTGWLSATAGGNVHLRSPTAPLIVRQVTAGGAVMLDAGQQLVVDGDVQAGQNAALTSAGDVHFSARGQVRGANVQIAAGTGGVGSIGGETDNDVKIVAANQVSLSAPDAIGATAPLRLQGQQLQLQSQRMDVVANTPQPQQALQVTATGVAGGLADSVALVLGSDTQVSLQRLAATNSRVNAAAPRVELLNGQVGNTAFFTTPTLTFRVDAQDRSPQPGYDLRAFTLDGRYRFNVTPEEGRFDALVLSQNPFKAIFSQPAGSALDITGQQLRLLNRAQQTDWSFLLQGSGGAGTGGLPRSLVRVDKAWLDCEQPASKLNCE